MHSASKHYSILRSWLLYLGHPRMVVYLMFICGTTACTDQKPSDFTGSASQVMQVVRVIDGDSIKVLNNTGKSIEIRLFGIDAPEKNQPFSKEAKQHAQRLLAQQTITVVSHELDRYKRLIATVYLEGSTLSVNEQLVDLGAVWVYRQYANDAAWVQREDRARQSKRGLWALPASKRMPPWQWRKEHSR